MSVKNDTSAKKNSFGFNALVLLFEMLANLSRNTAPDKETHKQNTLALFADVIKSIQPNKQKKAEKALSLNNFVRLAEIVTSFNKSSNDAQAPNTKSTDMVKTLLETLHQVNQGSKEARGENIKGGTNNEDHDEIYINDANYVKARKFENDFEKYNKMITTLKDRYDKIKKDFDLAKEDIPKPNTPIEDKEQKEKELKEIEAKLTELNNVNKDKNNKKELEEKKSKLEKEIQDLGHFTPSKNSHDTTDLVATTKDTLNFDDWKTNSLKQMLEDVKIQRQNLDVLEDECKSLDNMANDLYNNNIKISLKDLKKFIDELNKSEVLPYDDDIKRTIKELNLLLEYFSESNTNYDMYVDFTIFKRNITLKKTDIEKAKKNKDVKIQNLKEEIDHTRQLKLLSADKRPQVGVGYSPGSAMSPQFRQLEFGGGTEDKTEETQFKSFDELYEKIKQLRRLLKEFNDTSGNKSIATTLKIPSLYEDIWDEYVKLNRYAKTNGNLPIYADDMLYNKLKQHNLDPAVVLKLNFSDRIIFIITMFFIRLILVILIELLIDYNILRSLEYSVLTYAASYIIFIIILILVINFDAYKLRILINYLNMHVNSTKLFLHILLFIIFMALVYIMIKSNDTLNTFGDLFDFTHIYKHLYEITETSKTNSDNKLTQDEKLKLQYRLDIITMIVFIFTAFLILVI